MQRRDFLKYSSAFLAGTSMAFANTQNIFAPAVLKPRRLEHGQTIGLINPAGVLFEQADVEMAKEAITSLGFKVKEGNHLFDRYGYLGGRDEDRVKDLNAMFADPEVDALIAVRGGWGCNRLLHMVDYRVIRRNPKILVGYSDITSLLLALNARTGLVTFHGPLGISTWNGYSTEYFTRLLMDAEALTLSNHREMRPGNGREVDEILSINAGQSRGRLFGGNLAVLTSMIGSRFLPDFRDAILFVEEVGEEPYRVDRMLTQLKLAGILDSLSGFIFGKCTRCEPEAPDASLSLAEVLNDHIKPLGIPAWYGAMIGHISDKFTMPLGIRAEIDGGTGEIQLLESAVV